MSNENPHALGINGAVAAELRAERAAQNLTNGDIAGRSGIPVVSVQRYLATTRAIDLDNLEALAGAVGLDVQELISRARRRLAQQGPPTPSEVMGANVSEGNKPYFVQRLAEIDAENAESGGSEEHATGA